MINKNHQIVENSITIKGDDRFAKCSCGGDLSAFWLDAEDDRVGRWSKWSCTPKGRVVKVTL